MEKFCLVLLCLSCLQVVWSADNLVRSNRQSDTRTPVQSQKCGENELYWPVSGGGWTCDCAPRFLYYAPTDKCLEAYRQGPCEKNEYLSIPKGKYGAECIRNPCKNDTMVPYNGKCYNLYKTDACAAYGGGTLNINSSLDLECSPGSATQLSIINVNQCSPGSKINNNKCRVVVGNN